MPPFNLFQLYFLISVFKKTALLTDRSTDRRTDQWTYRLKVGECCRIFEPTAEFCSSNSEPECHFSNSVKKQILPNFEFRISNDFCFIKNCNKSVELYGRINDMDYIIFLTYIFFYIVFSINHHRIS